MAARKLGVDSVCCLLHNLIPGGSARQWIHLLGEHVRDGGRAAIVAPPGPLAEPARAAGIEVFAIDWEEGVVQGHDALWHLVSGHDLAIVHWDHGVMWALPPALSACGRAALVLHQAPDTLARWLPAEAVAAMRPPIVRAIDDKRAVALVRGASHARRVATAFGVREEDLDILPASIPLASVPFRPAPDEPVEILALMRLSPEKAPIAQLAVALTRARLDGGRRCRLTIAGAGPWQQQAVALCRRGLPPGAWRVEGAPADPLARLAAADLVVAQGLTTLEAAALGRRVVVARTAGADRASGVVLTPAGYDLAGRDPFGLPPLSEDVERLWEDLLALRAEDLEAIRTLVERHNSLEAASAALADALRATLARPAGR